jgi:hypothetical protein
LLIHTTGKASVDKLLSQVVTLYEAQFPGRVRGYYLTGSYAEGDAVDGSDIDLYILFKGTFISEDEAIQANELAYACAELSSARLDMTARSEQSQETLHSYVRVAIKQHSRLLYGGDTRESMSLPTREEYVRDATDSALEFLLRQHETGLLTYPLDYPDPDGAFFGYDQPQRLLRDSASVRRGTRLLVESACQIATALLALQAPDYIATKRESVEVYRLRINDEWASFLNAIFEKGKLQWGYNLPERDEECAELRALCARMLSFENYYLLYYRAYLLSLLRSEEASERSFALLKLKHVLYPDEEIVIAMQALENREKLEKDLNSV